MAAGKASRSARPGLAGFELWCRAMRWQRAVDRALEGVGLTHTQYWVLSTAAWLIAEVDDAVSQQEIAEAAQLDKATTSSLVKKLEAGGLLDRRPSSSGGPTLRVRVTSRGYRILSEAAPKVAGAARIEPVISR